MRIHRRLLLNNTYNHTDSGQILCKYYVLAALNWTEESSQSILTKVLLIGRGSSERRKDRRCHTRVDSAKAMLRPPGLHDCGSAYHFRAYRHSYFQHHCISSESKCQAPFYKNVVNSYTDTTEMQPSRIIIPDES